jgi:capsular exopolysaccharide synthesis family protein
VDAPACGPYPEDPEAESSLLLYWRILRRGKWKLALAAYLGVVATVLLTLPQTALYLGRTSLEIQPLNEDFLNLRQMSPVHESPATDVNLGDIPTQVEILQSDTLLARAAERLSPIPKPSAPRTSAATPTSTWRSILHLPKSKILTPQEAVLAREVGSLKVKSIPDTRIVEVTCDSPDPKVAASFVNAVAEEYIKQNLEVRWNMSQRTGEWLSNQLEDMRAKLKRSENALQAYARASGLIVAAENSTIISEDQLRNVQAELAKAQAERAAQQSRYEMARTSPPESLSDIVDSGPLQAFVAKLTDLRQQAADLGATYTPEHAKVKRLQAQIAELEAALNRQRQSILSRIKTDYDQALSRERLLLAEYTAQTSRVTEDAEKAVQYNILKREVDSGRTLYENLLGRVREAGIASAMRASNVRVVDVAQPAEFPYKPSLPRYAGLGLFGGLFLGATLLIVRDRFDRSIQNPEDASFFLGLSELGVIPSAPSAHRGLHYRHSRLLRGEAPASGGTARQFPAGFQPASPDMLELAILTNRSPMLTESFRATLTSILFSGQNGAHPRVLVFTSASPAEGKSTVTANLGIALAEAGQKVLLIDGDMRKPRLHTVFSLSNRAGLSDLLSDRGTPAAEALASLERESGVPNLSVLPSGPATAAATSLLYSPRLSDLIKCAREAYDMVLIDTPPAHDIADARVLGRVSDAVVIVIRSHRTSRDVLKNACQRFTEDGTHMLGVVLNDWDPRAGSTGSAYPRFYPGRTAS